MCVCDDNERSGEGHYERTNEKKRVTVDQVEDGEAIKPNIKKSLQHKVEFQSKRTNKRRRRRRRTNEVLEAKRFCAPPPR